MFNILSLLLTEATSEARLFTDIFRGARFLSRRVSGLIRAALRKTERRVTFSRSSRLSEYKTRMPATRAYAAATATANGDVAPSSGGETTLLSRGDACVVRLAHARDNSRTGDSRESFFFGDAAFSEVVWTAWALSLSLSLSLCARPLSWSGPFSPSRDADTSLSARARARTLLGSARMNLRGRAPTRRVRRRTPTARHRRAQQPRSRRHPPRLVAQRLRPPRSPSRRALAPASGRDSMLETILLATTVEQTVAFERPFLSR
jgi:hypothetical protein